MNARGKTTLYAVVFQGEVNGGLVLSKHDLVVKLGLFLVNHSLGEVKQGLLHIFVHRGADRVLALHLGCLAAVDDEVAADHIGVIVPAFEVGDGLSFSGRESESASV